jgi:hypothetical protein
MGVRQGVAGLALVSVAIGAIGACVLSAPRTLSAHSPGLGARAETTLTPWAEGRSPQRERSRRCTLNTAWQRRT